jgi:hypothetical protein
LTSGSAATTKGFLTITDAALEASCNALLDNLAYLMEVI